MTNIFPTHVEKIRAALPGALIILTAHDEMQRAGDMAYPFVQEPSFRWLTGIVEAGWVAVVTPGSYTLVAPERDETKVLFEGGLSTGEALGLSGADDVVPRADFDTILEKLSAEYREAYTIGPDPYSEHYSFVENPARGRLAKELERRFDTVSDCRPHFAKVRAIKSEDEIQQMRAAIDATIRGFVETKALLSSASREYQLEAQLSHAFRKTGMDGHAYDPIVASGVHACTLHYGKNTDVLKTGELVLIDAGASCNGYAADITRTWAIGTPTARQVAVYAAVEKAHREIIALIAPGVTFKAYQDSVDAIMKDALEGLGLLKDRDDTTTYRTYFPHAISHGLGIDVHESLGGVKEFAAGMVLTVEPGIYIAEEGIGVRIEDDILVTADGRENLSAALPTAL